MHTATMTLSRRAFLIGSLSAATAMSGCATSNQPAARRITATEVGPPEVFATFDAELEARYAAFEDGGHVVPAIPYRQMDPKYYRQRVTDPTGERAGTVVVDTPGRFLYLVEEGGTAMRYGVGIGREGFAWQGEGIIHWRQPWPRWKPPSEMIARQPDLERYSVANGGMDPGIANPLGARALYIFQKGQDTLYRLHGSPEWQSIGKSVSSGCVRFVNHDIVDLYQRIPYHARIVVHQVPALRVGYDCGLIIGGRRCHKPRRSASVPSVGADKGETPNQVAQARRFVGKIGPGGISLFNHRCILLGNLVHLIDCGIDLRQPNGLLTCRDRNRVHVLIDRDDVRLDIFQCGSRFAHELDAALYLDRGVADEVLDFFSRFS